MAEVLALGLTPCSSLARALGPCATPVDPCASARALPSDAALSAANDRGTFCARAPLPGGVLARTFEAAVGIAEERRELGQFAALLRGHPGQSRVHHVDGGVDGLAGLTVAAHREQAHEHHAGVGGDLAQATGEPA